MLARLFGKARFLDADLEDWSLDTWAWLMRHLGGMERLSQLPLATPSSEFFPPTDTAGEVRGAYIFETLKTLMGMEDWPCRLEMYERPEANARVGEFWTLESGSLPNGTFRVEDGEAVVAYAADLIARPTVLIATFAHELAHYLLASIEADAPGGDDVAIELATDLCVAYAGLGVFGANSAFEFAQHQDAFGQGWRSAHNGYFSERSWAFSIAVFCALSEQPLPERWLKPAVTDLTRQAARYLARSPGILEPLRAIP